MHPKMNNIFKDENGSGLVLALMVLLVLSVLGSALGVVTVGSYRLGDINRDRTSAYYIAEAGANMAYEEIKAEVETLGNDPTKQGTVFIKDVDDLLKDIDLTYDGENYFVKQSGQYPEVLIEIINETELNKDENVYSKEYIIQSTGNVDGKERTVNKPFEVTWVEENKTSEPIELPDFLNEALVIAQYFYNQTPNYKIEGEKLIGNSYLEPYTSVIEEFPKSPPNVGNLSEFSSNQTELTIDSGLAIEEMVINNNLTIDIGDDYKDVVLVVQDLTINSNINVIGNGKLNIYVTNSLKTGDTQSHVGNSSHLNQINILYYGENEINIDNNLNINGSIFIKNATINIDNKLIVEGILISGAVDEANSNSNDFDQSSIRFRQGAPYGDFNGVILAPFANVALKNNSEIHGQIIAQKVMMHAQTTISPLDSKTIDKFPFNSNSTNNSSNSNEYNVIESKPAIEQ